MSNNKTQPYKGARDFYPEDKAKQKWMFNNWRTVVEKYGYVEYDAPILEPTDLYLMKGSVEIVRDQTYTFEDRGKRSVTIRTEMTPSISRMVAGKRQELPLPARWYSIPNLWRYERMQRGRLREFWQLNVDVFGIADEQAEIEMLQIADDILQVFKAKRDSYTIKINSRKLVSKFLSDVCQLSEEKVNETIRFIDRMDKMDSNDFFSGLSRIVLNEELAQSIIETITIKDIEKLPTELQDLESVTSLKNILKVCREQGIHNAEFCMSLMRGFDYYTDIVFEVFDTSPENNRSMFGGGRYDGLVAEFGVEPIPTVGFGMGDVTFMNFLETHKLLEIPKNSVDLVVLIKEADVTDQARTIARDLRDLGLHVAVDFSGRKFDKQFKAAQKSSVEFALFVDSESVNGRKYILKNLVSHKEQAYSLERIAALLKDQR